MVCWGNLGSGLQQCSQPNSGMPKDNCHVDLLSDPHNPSYSSSPGDLFRGEKTATPQEQNDLVILPIYREVGSMTITVRNLQAFSGYTDENFSIVVGKTYSTIDFYGNHAGSKTAYQPNGSFMLNGNRNEYRVPTFNMVPEETNISLEIYHGTQKIATMSLDNGGKPINVVKGKQTNVLIELRANVSVDVELTDWRKEYLWKDF
ncbi:MAG: hypothetical protein LUD46_07025 [Parabacteroides sp.]|nr:hypothetical protein [Parabacteroides sp.]